MKLIKYFSLLLVAFLLLGCGPVQCGDNNGEECLRVLFIGNSYTYVNDLPGMFSELARSGGHQMEVGTIVEGGFALENHVEASQIGRTLTSSQWDYVVLQEQSQLPSVEYSRTNFMYPAVRILVKQIRSNNAQPLLFETWGHRYGYPENGMPSYESMQYEIDQGYLNIARELNVPVAQVGLAWFRALKNDPELQLWQEDGSHPSEQGTYLAACVFYVTLYKESPVGLNYRGNYRKKLQPSCKKQPQVFSSTHRFRNEGENMPAQNDFPIVFESLRSILKPYTKKLTVKNDTNELYYLDAAFSEKWKKELFFASAHIKKNYVSFYLMPVYMYPDLLKNISPELKKHMQGKSCFNFKKIEKTLFDELGQLTKQGFDRMMKEEYS